MTDRADPAALRALPRYRLLREIGPNEKGERRWLEEEMVSWSDVDALLSAEGAEPTLAAEPCGCRYTELVDDPRTMYGQYWRGFVPCEKHQPPTVDPQEDGGSWTLDRWRGTRGLMGWLTLKWDVWMLKRFARRLAAAQRDLDPTSAKVLRENTWDLYE